MRLLLLLLQVDSYHKQGFLLLQNLISPHLLAEVINLICDDVGDDDDDEEEEADSDVSCNECMQVSEEYDELFRRQATGGGRMEARLDPDN